MELPLFPLHTVLCPGATLPLHIFEPRYRALVRHCLDEEVPFGVVLIRDGREVGRSDLALAGVGTTARIRRATPLPDGRFDIVTVGERRFALEAVDAERAPYLVGEVRELDEPPGDAGRAATLGTLVIDRFIRYVERVGRLEADPGAEAPGTAGEEMSTGNDEATAALRERLTIPDDPTALGYLLTSIVGVAPLDRQLLLEAPSGEARLERLAELLEREILLLDRRLTPFIPDPRLGASARN